MVQVAERDDLFVLAAGHIVLAHAAHAHAGNPQLLACILGNCTCGKSWRHERRKTRSNRRSPRDTTVP